MDYNYIKNLIDRYFECETTPSEERMLRAFFSGNDVPEDLAKFKPLFDTFASESQETLSVSFKNRLLGKAGVAPVVEARPRVFSWRIALRPLYNAVAAVAIVMLVGHLAQISFGNEPTSSNEMNMAGSAVTDTIGSSTTTNLRAVGEGTQTAAIPDSLPANTSKQSNQ